LNDVCVLSPIFYKNKVVAFTACVFHHSDIGGRVSSDNHDVFEEGLFIPLVKLYDGGALNESLLEMIRWNVRTPDEVIGDIRSQIAANHVCAEKIGQMLSENKLDGLDDLANQITSRTERSMREEIHKIPDGIYRAEGIVERGLAALAGLAAGNDRDKLDLIPFGQNHVFGDQLATPHCQHHVHDCLSRDEQS
jgi:N-methylhydantoinase B